MTTEEFSNEFDVLLNSYSNISVLGEQSSRVDINLDEYEKSVFLTQAQEEVIRSLYNGNLTGESFEKTEELRRYLDVLIKTTRITLDSYEENGPSISNNSYVFKLPEDLLFITYEQAIIGYNTKQHAVRVIPIKQDEWHRIKNNPFKCPNSNKVIRVDYGNNQVELIAADDEISEYRVRYICKPTPIILITLPDDLSINGEHNITECKLNTALHRIILERAVQLAYRRFPQASK